MWSAFVWAGEIAGLSLAIRGWSVVWYHCWPIYVVFNLKRSGLFLDSEMILTANEIEKNVRNGNILIAPFLSDMVNPNSYDYRLDFKLLEIEDALVDPKKQTSHKEISLDKDGYILSPDKIYLANTYEEIGSNVFVPILTGKENLGRLGLFLQITADLGNLGAKHKWTLELKAVQPLKIYPMMRIGQVSFWRTKGQADMQYSGKYDKFSVAKSSEIYKEFPKSQTP